MDQKIDQESIEILLVDDEPDIREALDLYLSHMGYAVITAGNGERALALFKSRRPAIVLSDIKMPGMDGIELLREIKKAQPDTEVIMITGHGDMDLAIECLQQDATDFITKPFHGEALEVALKRAREKMSMRRQIREHTENLERLVEKKTEQLLEAERLAAVGQAVMGLSSAMRDIAGDIAFFNEMPCFVSIHNRDLKVVTANPLYKERLGNGIGGDSWSIYKDIAENGQECPVAETFRSGSGLRTKKTLIYADGSELPVMVHTAPIRNRDQEPELVLEISADISEVQRLQEALRSSRQRYQELFDEVPCYISVQDRDFKITAANRRFKEDFGTAVGAFCYDIYKHRDEACDNCPVAKTFEDGLSHQSEMVVTTRTGAQCHVLVWTAPIRNAAGRLTQVMEMSTDITQIRKLQDNLTSLGFLIGSISHGIKGVLTGMDAAVYLLESGYAKQDADRVEEGLEVVKLMVDRIRSLVMNVLFYAKRRALNWKSIDVLKFVHEVAFVIEPKVDRGKLAFVSEFSDPLGRFEVDDGAFRSALINFLENAIDACLEDRSGKNSHRVIFAVRQDADAVIFEITDNGVGMNRETRENMFNLFFSSKGHAGSGLGLFIANRIVQQHGGSIGVASEPGKGSRFTIRMPRVLSAQAKSLPADAGDKDMLNVSHL